MSDTDSKNFWYSEVSKEGILLSSIILEEYLSNGPEKIPEYKLQNLRDIYTEFKSNPNEKLYKWLDHLFDKTLEIPPTWWEKENAFAPTYKYFKYYGSKKEILFPNRVFRDCRKGLSNEPRYLLKIDKVGKKLGIGSGRKVYRDFLELLRNTNIQLGLLTNGEQFRLIYAGNDYESWIEWKAKRWFTDETEQLLASFNTLCGLPFNAKKEENKGFLLYLVQESRIKQEDLSIILGEQIKLAVEDLNNELVNNIRDNEELHKKLLINPLTKTEITEREKFDALFQASIKIFMKLVITLYAEARELFPKSLEIYSYSYGLEGLYKILKDEISVEGKEYLETTFHGWLRINSLFKMVYEGSHFPEISIIQYGGDLFRPGNFSSEDNVSRALALFESTEIKISDAFVYELLNKLKTVKLKTRQRNKGTLARMVVDFSNLRTEHIGMMYEGLLDYQLRQVKDSEGAIIVLNFGLEPAIPLTSLEKMEEKNIKLLFENLANQGKKGIKSEEGDAEDDNEENEDEENDDKVKIKDEVLETEFIIDNSEKRIKDEILEKRVEDWAIRVIETINKVKKTKGKSEAQYKNEVIQEAKNLIKLIIPKGRNYLIHAGGNRKGSGTFYTKPQLVIPTVRKALNSLIFELNEEGESIPKLPEKILALKVLDPAMGSGSFLVSILRYLTNCLFESLQFHLYIRKKDENNFVFSLPDGIKSENLLPEDMFQFTEKDEFEEEVIKAKLKRYVVESCIYGVDINPLAVELAKMSLWIEILDKEVPFTFLDSKLKCGNTLIGTWFSYVQNYPIMAWSRETGDEKHTNGIHFQKDHFSNKLKKFVNEKFKIHEKPISTHSHSTLQSKSFRNF